LAQVVASLGQSLAGPASIVDAMQRAGLYQLIKDAAVMALSPPEGSGAPQEMQLFMAAAAEALTPDIVKQALSDLTAQAFRLVRDPEAPPELRISLAGFRESLIAALTKKAKELKAPGGKTAEILAEIRRQIPDALDVFEQMELEVAPFRDAAGYYAQGMRALPFAIGGLGALILLYVLAASRAWKVWVGAPLLTSGLAVIAAGIAARSKGIPALADIMRDKVGFPPGIDQVALFEAVRELCGEVLRTAFTIGAVSAAAGAALLLMYFFFRREPGRAG
jgi:hypothetical protein